MTTKTDQQTTQTAVEKTETKRTTRKTTPKVVTVVTKKNPFRPETKRHLKWKCVKNDTTVSETVAAMKAKGLSSPRTFLYNYQKMGRLKIA